MKPSSKRILLVVRYEMMRRMIFQTPVLPLLAGVSADIHVMTPTPKDAEVLAPYPNLHWHDIERPTKFAPRPRTLGTQLKQFAHRGLQTLLKGKADYGNLAFRFNHLSGFQSHRLRQGRDQAYYQTEARAGNFLDPALGQPWVDSWQFWRSLYALHYAPWQYNDIYIENFFDQYPPDLVILIQVQNPDFKPYILAAHRRRIPVLGMVGSWDQPTTKGAVLPAIGHFAVHNQRIAQEMTHFHHIPPEFMTVTGLPQMDVYRAQAMQTAAEFRARWGMPAHQKIIVFGANAARLGGHEPEIIQAIVQQLQAGAYGEDVSLVIRPHPIDSGWRERFGAFEALPQVVFMPPQANDLTDLANLLHHATLVLATAGSILLDAVAQDTAVAGVAFSFEMTPSEQIANYYRMDHNAAAVATGGVEVAYNWTALDAFIRLTLANPDHNQAARARLRASHLEPLDGQSSARFVNLIERSLAGKVPFSQAFTHYPWRKR